MRKISSFCNLGGCVEVEFKAASFCSGGQCVAVAHREGEVLVRDNKVEDGPVLTFTAEEWDAFVKGVKNGEFDGF